MEKKTKTKAVRKRMKRIAACILSVFAFAVAMFHPVGSVEAQAATTYSDQFFDQFTAIPNDAKILSMVRYVSGLNRDVDLTVKIPASGGPYFYYMACYPMFLNDANIYPTLFVLYPASDSFDLQCVNTSDNTSSANFILSGSGGATYTYKGQHYKMMQYSPSSSFSSDLKSYELFMKHSTFSSFQAFAGFRDGTSTGSGTVVDPSGGGSGGSYDESNASYKRDLGYLQGMSKKTIMLYGDNASQDTNTAKYKFSYAKTSNSGFDLTQDDVYIRLYAQVAVYDNHGKGENIMVNMPKTFVGQYEASSLSLTVSAMDIFNANSDVWSQINTASWQWKTVLHGYQRMDKLYFQIVAKNPDGTWSYGGYTTLNDKVSSTGEQVTVVGTQTPDGGKDIDYAYNENISSSAGVGSTYKDAEANADSNASGDGGFKLTGFNGLVEIFDSFKNGLSSFTYAFGDFPELIAKTFPFLPAFITSAISLGFLVAVVLRLLGR